MGAESYLPDHVRGLAGLRAAPLGTPVLVTVHPSSILRMKEPADRHAAFDHFVRDLRPVLDDASVRVAPAGHRG